MTGSGGRRGGSRDDDGSAGRFVRPFAIKVGDTAQAEALDLVSMVTATRAPGPQDALHPEREQILRRCTHPQSIAELAAHLALPLGVVRLLVAGLVSDGSLRLRAPDPQRTPSEDDSLLHLVLEGLRAL